MSNDAVKHHKMAALSTTIFLQMTLLQEIHCLLIWDLMWKKALSDQTGWICKLLWVFVVCIQNYDLFSDRFSNKAVTKGNKRAKMAL